MTALRKSTSEILAMRMFGTVRKDLNRMMTARTEPLPSTTTDERRPVNAVITILVENGLAGCIFQRSVETARPAVSRFVQGVSLHNICTRRNKSALNKDQEATSLISCCLKRNKQGSLFFRWFVKGDKMFGEKTLSLQRNVTLDHFKVKL